MAYIGNSPGVASQRVVTQFTATSNQTTFTPTSGYTIGYLDVFLNGVKLVNGKDYTASNGTTVVLAAGAAADDSVEVVSFIPRGLSDGWLKSEADSRYLQLGASFSGDVSGTYSAITLANSGVTAGSYGSATNIPAITVDSKGRLTSVTNTAVSIPSGSLTFTGDVTGSGSTGSSTSLTLASVGTAGTYTKVTTDAKGRVTSGGTLASGDLPTYTGTLTSSQITTALGFTPENLANKAAANGYASLDSSGKVPTAQLSGFVDQTKPNIRPTLNLDFANSKIVDSRITFTRTTTATYYDLQGILKYAQPDEPRIDHDPSTGECRGLLIEEQRTNLFRYSNNMSIGGGSDMWLSQLTGTSASYRTNFGIAPDGTMTSSRIIGDGGRIVAQAVTGFYSTGTGNYTFSIWIKCTSGGGSVSLWSGTSGGASGNIAFSANNTWTRYSCTVSVTGNNDLSITINSGTILEFWGPQYEAGSFATSYIPSTTTFTSRASSATYFDSTGVLRLAGTNQARYGYGYDTTSGKWISQGLVLEAAATNLYDSSIGTLTQLASTTVTPNALTAPDGSLSAQRVTSSGNYVYKYLPNIVGNSVVHTMSFFVKPVNNLVRFSVGGTAGSMSYILDFSTFTPSISFANGSNATNYGSSLTSVGNSGWWRFTGTFSFSGAAGYTEFQWSYSGGSNLDAYLWGMQIETGYVATSYIPTYGATATRAADVSSSASTTRANDLGLMSNTAWYTPDFTMAAEGYSISGNADVGGAPAIVAVDDGTSSNRIQLRRNRFGGSGSDSGFVYRVALNIAGSSYSIDGVVPYANIPSYWANAEKHKTAMSITTNSQLFGADGFATSVSSITAPTLKNVQRLWVGWGDGGRYWNGHIAKIAFYPKNMTLAQLQALTQ